MNVVQFSLAAIFLVCEHSSYEEEAMMLLYIYVMFFLAPVPMALVSLVLLVGLGKLLAPLLRVPAQPSVGPAHDDRRS
jgi:hypothetical protein